MTYKITISNGTSEITRNYYSDFFNGDCQNIGDQIKDMVETLASDYPKGWDMPAGHVEETKN